VRAMTTRAVHDPAAEPSDDALIAAARDGDQAAFTALFRRHADRVRSLLTRLVGPVVERDDLVQQVFLALHRSLATYRGDAALTTFLHRIAVNVACDHLRARKRRRDEPTSEAGLEHLLGASDGRDHTSTRDELVRMFALLNRLDPDKRIAFVLVAVEGLSLADAASLVGASPDAVKQRVLTARRELAALIDRDARRGGMS
jgi:RNA polymerase sigma-70 factor, ECF subfamily